MNKLCTALLAMILLARSALCQNPSPPIVLTQTFAAAGQSVGVYVAPYTNHTITFSPATNAATTGCLVQVDSGPTSTGPWTAAGIVVSTACNEAVGAGGTVTVTGVVAQYARINVTAITAGTISVTYSAVNAAVSKGSGISTAAGVVALFSTCSGTKYLGADGACHNAGGSGTVINVTVTGDGIVDSSTPSTAVTTSGTLTLTAINQAANLILAGPANGSAAAPTFRSLVSLDIPNNAANTTGSAASLSISGQTGLMTVAGLTSTNRIKTVRDAADTLLELGGSYTPTGTWTSMVLATPNLGTPSAINLTNATGAPTWNQNTTGSAASLSVSGQSGLLTFAGLTSTNRAKTVRDAADTILELGGNYTPTGTWTNLTLVTPALGTPSALVLTNATGLPVTGIVALSANNAQTSTYQVLASDFSGYKLITVASGSFTITLVASGSQPANGQYIRVLNYGSGTVTLARSGQNINGAASNLTLPPASNSPTEVFVDSDGANYFASSASLNAQFLLNKTWVAPGNIGSTTPATGTFTTISTGTNCSSAASPAVCAAAAAGSVALPTGTNPTLVVNTTAVTANSQIILTVDESLGTKLSVTCNTTLSTLLNPVVTARSAGTSFTFTIGAVIATNPACVSYSVIN